MSQTRKSPPYSEALIDALVKRILSMMMDELRLHRSLYDPSHHREYGRL